MPRFSRFARLLATGFAATLCMPVLAQERGPVLRVDDGTVMTSSGGEFVSSPGGAIQTGNRVMVAEGGRATLVYPDDCTQVLEEPGVYTVAETCNAVRPAAGMGSGRFIVGGVLALGAVAALAGGGDGGGDDPPPRPPVSR